MFELFFEKVEEKIYLSNEEKEVFKSFLLPKKLKKKQYLLQDGEVCKYSAFVEKGALRSFTTDEKGNEHILQFAIEGWWIGDIYSFLTKERSTCGNIS